MELVSADHVAQPPPVATGDSLRRAARLRRGPSRGRLGHILSRPRAHADKSNEGKRYPGFLALEPTMFWFFFFAVLASMFGGIVGFA